MSRKPDPEMIDDENPEWTDETTARSRPAAEVMPDLVKATRRTRGPQKAPTKVSTNIRLSPEVIDFFRKDGKNWQRRVNDVLADYVKEHSHNGKAG